ncbi:MAG: Stage V sporulation protein E Required for spore cortex synthesi [Parcubacteria group bacterium Gr01-1014_107]|nr:MAG: Stage V sporulation protein E Required for spore cortex synthesi [Parcubacteria group bacterium Gr01-1014_107]
MKIPKVDRLFLLSIIILVVVGFFIFSSASLSLIAEGKGNFGRIALNQSVLGLLFGTIAMIFLSQTNYRVWRKYAFYILVVAIVVTTLVFMPNLGFEHAGAKRWLSLGPFSFQPAEFLKIGFVIYLATWLSGIKQRIEKIYLGLGPFLIISSVVGVILLSQPDIATFAVIASAGIGMFASAGAKWRDILIIGIIGAVSLGAVIYTKPYAMERINTFLDPTKDTLGASYQLEQSLIAIGSGGMFGRGFGQSIQKFSFLPEPIGDSIFAVAAEEFGFVGGTLLILLFLFFASQGLKIAYRSPDAFGGLTTIGIVILIVSQSFINIASMLGVIPLSGLPLIFISHGGTALFFTLASLGIVLNISRYQSR